MHLPEKLLQDYPGAGAIARFASRVAVHAHHLHHGGGWRPHDRDGDMWGWLPATFFGLGIPVAVAQVLGMGTLTLDVNGFESSQMFQRQRVLWKDAAGFIAVDTLTADRKLVCYDDANVSGRIADINDTVIGRNAALPDTYNLTAEALAQLMNTWRARALPDLLARTNLSV